MNGGTPSPQGDEAQNLIPPISERLFALEAVPLSSTTSVHDYNAISKATELAAVAKLLRLGHKVALPVIDDDGVDLIVNYRTTVQVKSSAFRNKYGRLRVGLELKPHIDVLLVQARDTEVWWVIPRTALEETGGYIVSILLTEGPITSRKSRRKTLSEWREAWHVFDTAGVR